jgi:hypothetical protein
MIGALRRIRNRSARTALGEILMFYWYRGVSTTDTFPASYRGSGSMWVRFLLFGILTGESEDCNVVGPTLSWRGY